MKRILVIGVGAGHPGHLTVQAIEAMNRADAFFVPDKGAEKHRLAALRLELCRRFATARPYRLVEAPIPERDRTAADYPAAVAELDRAKAALFGRLIADALGEDECGAFLVWGDPALYDGTIRILQDLLDAGRRDFAFEVVPGISSLQALAASHRTTLSRIGSAFGVTTGRRLLEHGFPPDLDSVAVMLDATDVLGRLADEDLDIHWGAYLGMPEEILISGRLRDVSAEILRRRRDARA
ncbi:MAG: precorrin-6A synthase (deacetylating), partial [Gluconacetobacter diazotrophicus]|nr:precorrin-6A synthase (deacetylating) [Gluconacetobacter diazotrophicus]